ncbi:hypothetical protein BDZ89DRAFT_1126743 [Hymenopellis radicata]|nr:hypothetical protein BDZ89DRAFT_1126743 [Hymenopellis radicata]
MFDFVSPFDALSSTSSQVKKKPVPSQHSVSSTEDSSWTNVSDPKRRSVDNLLEQMSNIRPYPQSVSAYDFYDPAPSDYTAVDSSRSRQPELQVPPPPIPPKPPVHQRPESPPRPSPPKTQAQRARLGESPVSSQPSAPPGNGNRRDKESSPGPRGSIRRGRGAKNFASSNMQPQTIIFDVAQPMEEIQASRDFVKSTAIALVKQETVFLPGTTIGATHWVAYAMSRGRVRVISRSNGDRTLLQLPPVFGNASVSDMAVHGNRLAGVTTDGGFVVWELPDVITDDVPGHLLLCVAPPTSDADPLMSVKWHPKEPDTLAVASENLIYLIDLANVVGLHDGTISQSDLRHLGHTLTLTSPLVSFDFDVLQQALITISIDSVLTTWNTLDQVPYANHKIRGEDPPSSLTYADGVIVVGRRYGTVFQLLSANTKAILSTIKFVNSSPIPDDYMFGHVCYDARIQTLWIANSKRESIIAFKLNIDSPVLGDEPGRGFVDQVVEFTGPKATIHFVILTADADPRGDEAYAACIAAKVTPSELALAAFSVHSSGVDQILIRKEWYMDALASTAAKFPLYIAPSAAPDPKSQKQQQVARPRSPQSEDGDDVGREETRAPEPRGKGQKGNNKNVTWSGKDEGVEAATGGARRKRRRKSRASTSLRRMKKMEDNLHQRITRTLNKEMDKQHQRFEDARAHEQAEDFARQEKILKLISTELTRNTTRVVEVAVKNEVQNSVLPALEIITKSEVKSVLTDQVGRAMNDLVTRRLPAEMENLLLRPEFANKLSQALANNLSVIIDRQVKEAVSQVVVPEIHAIKNELSRWQTEAQRSQEASIAQLERTVRALSDQVKFLTTRPPSGTPPQKQPPPPQPMGMAQAQMNQPQMQSAMQPRMGQPMPPLPHSGSMGQAPQQPPPGWYPHDPQPQSMPPSWYGRGIAAPQPSHPVQPPPTMEKPITVEEMSKYEDQFLEALSSSNTPRDLINIMARTNIDTVLPLRPDAPTLSQTIVIVIIHRNTSVIDSSAPSDMSFKIAMQWLHRALLVLRLDVMPTAYRLLGIAEKRLALLPDKSPSTTEGIHHLRDVRRIIEQKIPSATKQADATNTGPANAGQA